MGESGFVDQASTGLPGGPGKPVLQAPTEAISHSGRALDVK